MGSVAEEIVRLASCPVLTVGPRSVVPLAPLNSKRILYATDFSEASLRALPVALSLGQEFEAYTVLAHVVPNPIDDPGSRQHIEGIVAERLRDLAPDDAAVWVDQEYHVEFGSPVDGILRAARDRQVDLIVMGAGGIGATLHTSGRMGAIADSVVSLSTCPVLTLRR